MEEHEQPAGGTGASVTEANEAARRTAETINEAARGSMYEVLGIRLIEATPERVVATLPVTSTTKQPLGVLHGGATVALAESAASTGTWLALDHERFECYGLEINCNHLRTKREGLLRAVATPLHRGRGSWVWDIRVHDEQRRLIAVARCTVAIVPRRDG